MAALLNVPDRRHASLLGQEGTNNSNLIATAVWSRFYLILHLTWT